MEYRIFLWDIKYFYGIPYISMEYNIYFYGMPYISME